MVFSSLIFLYGFLPLCLLCYAACKKIETRNAVLIVFSLLFYAWGEPTRIKYLLLSALVNYCLLYTSPSPRDLSTSRMPSSA